MGTDQSTTDSTELDSEDQSPFRTEAEYSATPADLIQELLEIWVITPLKVLWTDYRGKLGVLIVVFYILMGTVGTLIVPEPSIDRTQQIIPAFQTLEYPLGTDGMGRGLLGLMVHSTPMMLQMILSGTLFGGMMGLALGLLCGYKGGTLDKTIMTFTDIIGSIPGLPLMLILVALIEPTDPYLIGIVLNIQGWVGSSRGIRSQAFAIRKKDYVEASEAMGTSTSNILFRDFLPELMPMITIGFLGGATGIIHASVGLYFLGILPHTHLNWGTVLNHAYDSSGALYSLEAAHWLLVPVITLTMLTFGFTMLAQAFDRVFNPRVRAQHKARKQRKEGVDDEIDEPTDISQVGVQ